MLLAILALAACATPSGSIGALLGKDVHDGRLYVREVPATMEAARAGLEEGDEIVAIDGTPATGLSAGEVHAKLVGPLGSSVTLVVLRAGTSRTVVVTRGPLAPP